MSAEIRPVALQRCLVIAGEPSGDTLAAELIQALRAHPCVQAQTWPLRVFGAGGARLAATGAAPLIDLTTHAAVGLAEVLKNYRFYRRHFDQLLELAFSELPDLILLVDFSGFNRRFARALRRRLARVEGTAFHNWRPRIVYYVSPQVWASRPGRAAALETDVDLLLSIFPFERAWYAARAPKLSVEFIGHPMIDRHASTPRAVGGSASGLSAPTDKAYGVLLPGSRRGELARHLPPMLDAVEKLARTSPLRWRMVLPNAALMAQARDAMQGRSLPVELVEGQLGSTLANAQVAMASTGTITLELAYFGVPTVALYKTSKLTYEIGRRIIRVRFLSMPNLLANEEVFPEFIQDAATGENLARAVSDLLGNPRKQETIRHRLREIVLSLGAPGACHRGADAIVRLLQHGGDDAHR